jgi:hypothetical protein
MLRYETFRLRAQLNDVVCTLPHDSAMVSNTRSCRTSGFTYGFFTVRFVPSAEASWFFRSMVFMSTSVPRSV